MFGGFVGAKRLLDGCASVTLEWTSGAMQGRVGYRTKDFTLVS